MRLSLLYSNDFFLLFGRTSAFDWILIQLHENQSSEMSKNIKLHSNFFPSHFQNGAHDNLQLWLRRRIKGSKRIFKWTVIDVSTAIVREIQLFFYSSTSRYLKEIHSWEKGRQSRRFPWRQLMKNVRQINPLMDFHLKYRLSQALDYFGLIIPTKFMKTCFSGIF